MTPAEWGRSSSRTGPLTKPAKLWIRPVAPDWMSHSAVSIVVIAATNRMLTNKLLSGTGD